MGKQEGSGKDVFSSKWSPRDTNQDETISELRVLFLKLEFDILKRN